MTFAYPMTLSNGFRGLKVMGYAKVIDLLSYKVILAMFKVQGHLDNDLEDFNGPYDLLGSPKLVQSGFKSIGSMTSVFCIKPMTLRVAKLVSGSLGQ